MLLQGDLDNIGKPSSSTSEVKSDASGRVRAEEMSR